jgi:peptide/nickel transport system substrate-binding protein
MVVPAVPQPDHESKGNVKKGAHGAYETVDKDGAELRQGRYIGGIPGSSLNCVLVGADPKSFNPWVADDTSSLECTNLMFRGLTDVDLSSGDVIPDMAAEIKLDPDKVTYHTRLRKGLKWSDGSPINAEDVAFTWNRLVAQGYGNAALRDAALVDGKMPECTVESELENKFVTAKPAYSFNRTLSTLKIAPKHIIEPVINSKEGRSKFKELWSSAGDFGQIVSSGPFSVSAVSPGDRVEFSRTSNFYMIDKNGCQLPYLDKLSFILAPEVGAAVLSFGRAETDLAQIRPRDYSFFRSQEKKQNFHVFDLGVSSVSTFLVFNLNQRKGTKSLKPFVEPTKSQWFNDTNFRQAVNHAIDRQSLVKEFFKGAGAPCFSSEPRCSPFFNESLPAFGEDLRLSQALLGKSGFVKKSDGALYDSAGNRVRFTLAFAKQSKLYEALANTIATNLKHLGITVDLELLDVNQVQDIANGLGPKNWEAQLFSVSCDPLDPHSNANLLCSNGHLHLCDQRDPDLHGDLLVNDARPWEIRLDQIYTEAESEFDSAKRKSLYYEAQKIIYDEAPYIYLVAPDVIVAARNSVKNYMPTPLSQASLGLYNVEEIYIDKNKSSTREAPAASNDEKGANAE